MVNSYVFGWNEKNLEKVEDDISVKKKLPVVKQKAHENIWSALKKGRR